jgi:hypothetical protein
MKTNQGWGWLAAGVLALGLNGVYQDGGAARAHRVLDRVADRSGALVDMASGTVDQWMERVELVAARGETTSCKLATAMARLQTGMARTQTGWAHLEAMTARQEAATARVEANRARIEARVARVRLAPMAFDAVRIPVVACPRVRVKVPIVKFPQLPMVRVPAPVMDVHLVGAEPI